MIKRKQAARLHKDLISVVMRDMEERKVQLPVTLQGYTKLAMVAKNGSKSSFTAHPFYRGNAWYDWDYVSYWELGKYGEEQENLYPARILGFIEMPCDDKEMEQCAVVHCAESPVKWADVKKQFIKKFSLSINVDTSCVTVPLTFIVHPIAVFPHYGGVDPSCYFVVLPKRNWSRYFGDRIKS